MTDATAIAPLLSICIPTFNRAAMLRTCLAELRPVVQALPFPVEVVISDNHSTDETRDVLRDSEPAFADLEDFAYRLRVIRPARHIEAIEHYVEVMRHARGKYAIYLADDDALLPVGLVAAVGWMQQNPDMVACFHPQMEVEQGTDTVQHIAALPGDGDFIIPRGDYLAACRLLGPAPFHPEVPLVRAEAWRRHVVRPAKTFFGFWLLASLLKVGDVGIGHHGYYKHRLRPQSVGASNQIQWEFAVDRMDQNRLGMELLFYRYLQSSGGKWSPEQRRHVLEFFAGRMAQYASIAARVCALGGDLQAAAELLARNALWTGASVDDIDEGTLDRRVDAEINRRARAHGSSVFVAVETAAEREDWIGRGCGDPANIVARADVREALRVTR